jgi:hypothetical protein
MTMPRTMVRHVATFSVRLTWPAFRCPAVRRGHAWSEHPEFQAHRHRSKLGGTGTEPHGLGSVRVRWSYYYLHAVGPLHGFRRRRDVRVCGQLCRQRPVPAERGQPTGQRPVFPQATNNLDFVIKLTEPNGKVTSFYSFANFGFTYSNPVCTGSPSACSVSGVGATPNATISGPITGTFDPTPTILPSGVVSAGNYGAFSAIARPVDRNLRL